MKNVLTALLPLLALVTGCASNADDVAPSTEALTTDAPGSELQRHLFRGGVDADGRRLTVEVEVTTTRAVSQHRYCDRYSDTGELYAGASISAGFSAPAGSITTRVRDAAGVVVGEARSSFLGLSAYDNGAVDPSVACTKDARIADRSPVRELSLLIAHGWIPGVVAKVPGGDVWINPSYGGPGTQFVSFQGIARFETDVAGTLGPRPFDDVGQELSFARGTLTLEIQPELEIEVGWDVDELHAKTRAPVTLRQ